RGHVQLRIRVLASDELRLVMTYSFYGNFRVRVLCSRYCGWPPAVFSDKLASMAEIDLEVGFRLLRKNESPMTPLLSDCSPATSRIRRNNSGKYYGKIPYISR